MRLRLLFLLAGISAWTTAAAQTGEWLPAGGNFARPRTLLKPDKIEATRARLSDPFFKGIYRRIWDEASTQNMPATGSLQSAMLAKNVAFVLLLDRKPQETEIVPLTEADRTLLRNKILIAFGAIDPEVGTAVEYDAWQWRSKELIGYLCAYDLALGAGMTESELQEGKERLQTFAGNLHREATRSVAGISFFTAIKNNHALMTAAALGMAAVVLNNAGSAESDMQPVTWFNTSLWNIDNLLWVDAERRLSEPGVIAGYAEGPHYFRYAFLNILPFIHALGNVLPDGDMEFAFNGSARTTRHPFYDPNYDLLYEWIARIRTPDGLMPPIEDSFRGEGFPELALTGKREYLFPITSGNTTISAQLLSTVDMEADFIAAGLKPLEAESRPLYTAFTEGGNLVFRSSWEPDAIYMHVSAEQGTAREGGGGHNQADASSFMMMVGGEMMALDPGYVQYDLRDTVGRATDHNMILVDGRGPEIGTPGAANDADARLSDTFSLPGLEFGNVTTAYQGAEIERNFLFLRNYYMAVADFVTSDAQHTYTWQLHGNGLEGGTDETGTFTADLTDREAAWEHNDALLSAHVVARNETGTLRTEKGIHETGYNAVGEHTTLLADAEGTETEFLAGLVPRAIISDIDFESHADDGNTTLIARMVEHDIISISRDTTMRRLSVTQLSLPSEIRTDARLIAVAASPFSEGMPPFVFMKEGTAVSYANRDYLLSDRRTDLALVRLEEGEYVGYCKDSARIYIRMDESISDVVGDGVRSWMMLWATGRVAIDLSKGGYFRLTSTSSTGEERPLPAEEPHLTAIVREGGRAEFTVAGTFEPGAVIHLYDLTGRLIRTVPVDGGNRAEADVRALPSGLYFPVLLGNGGKILDRTRLMLAR